MILEAEVFPKRISYIGFFPVCYGNIASAKEHPDKMFLTIPSGEYTEKSLRKALVKSLVELEKALLGLIDEAGELLPQRVNNEIYCLEEEAAFEAGNLKLALDFLKKDSKTFESQNKNRHFLMGLLDILFNRNLVNSVDSVDSVDECDEYPHLHWFALS